MSNALALALAPDVLTAGGGTECDGPGRILTGVLDTFERGGLAFCVLHGYEAYPQHIRSDVDCVVDHCASARQIYTLLHQNSTRIGATLVRCKGYYIVLAGKNSDGSPCLLTLDLGVDCALGDLTFYTGAEVLKDRRRLNGFWVPAPNKEFAAYFAMSIAKGRLEDARTQRLSKLYREDPAGCEQQLARFCSSRFAALAISAATSSDWSHVRACRDQILAELRLRAIARHPLRYFRSKLSRQLQRVQRIWQPDGLSVALLGPDGSGKSSSIELLGGCSLPAVFDRSVCLGFAPPLHRLLGRNHGPSSEPHGLPSRSLANCLLRSVYWFVYSTLDQCRVRFALARSTLVLYDRHFVDILVDPKRYRYSGPKWLLQLIWRVIPKPNLVVLLHAPAEIVHSRKQELPLDETARQERSYLALVRSLKNGRIIDATQPLEAVVQTLTDVILRTLQERTARRLGLNSMRHEKLEPAATCSRDPS